MAVYDHESQLVHGERRDGIVRFHATARSYGSTVIPARHEASRAGRAAARHLAPMIRPVSSRSTSGTKTARSATPLAVVIPPSNQR